MSGGGRKRSSGRILGDLEKVGDLERVDDVGEAGVGDLDETWKR